MPKIRFEKDGTGSITYDQDDWLAGMDTTSAGPTYGKLKGNPKMDEIDPLRNFGYVSPAYLAEASTDNGGSIVNILRSSVVNNTDAFIVSGGSLNNGAYSSGAANIQKLTLSSNTLSTSSFPHNITVGSLTSISGDDMTHYYTATTLKAFYSYFGSNAWDVGTLTYPTTFDDDFMSTVPTTPLAAPYILDGASYPHPLIVGDDDILYIGDRNFVHSYNRTTSVFTAAVLTLPQGWIITCFTRTQDLRLAIGTYYATMSTFSVYNRGQAKVWIWTYGNLDVDYGIDLKDNYISELVPWGNTIAAFTYGRKSLSDYGSNKLQQMVGTQFEVVVTWGSTGSVIELPIRGGVDVVKNDLYWNAGGQVMSYTQRPDTGQYILNNIVTNEATPGATSGLLKFFSAGSLFHASFGTGSSGLQWFRVNYNDSGSLQCQVVTPEWPVLMKGQLTRISIKFKDTFTGGRSLTLNTKLDASTPTLISSFTASSNLRVLQQQTRSDGTPLGFFSSLQPQLVWAAGSGATDCPVVEYVKYEFSLVNATTT